MRVSLRVDADPALSLSSDSPPSLSLEGEYVGGTPYRGEYSVTPSSTAQVLHTSGLVMSGDMTVAPIPSNYGRIGWNGSALTVS